MIESTPRPFITSANCFHIREVMGPEWTIYWALIVEALTIASGLCEVIFYKLYGHPWEATL